MKYIFFFELVMDNMWCFSRILFLRLWTYCGFLILSFFVSWLASWRLPRQYQNRLTVTVPTIEERHRRLWPFPVLCIEKQKATFLCCEQEKSRYHLFSSIFSEIRWYRKSSIYHSWRHLWTLLLLHGQRVEINGESTSTFSRNMY